MVNSVMGNAIFFGVSVFSARAIPTAHQAERHIRRPVGRDFDSKITMPKVTAP
jgi:hypothetical protein